MHQGGLSSQGLKTTVDGEGTTFLGSLFHFSAALTVREVFPCIQSAYFLPVHPGLIKSDKRDVLKIQIIFPPSFFIILLSWFALIPQFYLSNYLDLLFNLAAAQRGRQSLGKASFCKALYAQMQWKSSPEKTSQACTSKHLACIPSWFSSTTLYWYYPHFGVLPTAKTISYCTFQNRKLYKPAVFVGKMGLFSYQRWRWGCAFHKWKEHNPGAALGLNTNMFRGRTCSDIQTREKLNVIPSFPWPESCYKGISVSV